MRKLLVVLMVVAFASTAFAVDVKLSGDFEVKGIFLENTRLDKDSDGSDSWWEQDGNVQAVFNLGKGTKFTVRGDFRDGTWGTPGMGAKQDGTNAPNNTYSPYGDETGFTVQRAFLQHVFENGLDLRAGLMATGGWGTAFRNNVEGNYRVRLGVPVANGVVTFQTTKQAEFAQEYPKSEKDDSDQYGVDYVGKTGAFTYGANLTYTKNGRANQDFVRGNSDSNDTVDLTLLFTGDFGQFGFESEFAYIDVSRDSITNGVRDRDYDLFGAYINGFGKFDKTTAGLAFVYGSVDKKTQQAFEYGDDFDTTFIIDELGGVTGGDDLQGFTTFKLYADYAHTDALTLGAALAYAFSNYDDAREDIKLYEFDAYVSYDINEYLNYTVKAAYLKVKDYAATGGAATTYDVDDVYYASHTLSISF